MGGLARRGLGRIALLAVLAFGTGFGGSAHASRGKEGSLPAPRGPKLPKKLPAAAPAVEPSDLEAAARAGRNAPGERPGAPERLSVVAGTTEYADGLDALSPQALAFERSAEASYAYCLRVTATYEHAWFDSAGELRRGYARAVQHGTGFAFRASGGEYFVATNFHVVTLPEVTGTESTVDGVPPGSRKVREVVHIVRSEEDDYAPGFIELTRVVADAARDVSILKTQRPLRLMPWRLGRSADLRLGNMVLTRGYPLGVLPAANVGRVTSTRHEDTESGWDHVDFITDAALNNGNSGSPVLAISRRTREPELVGIFHARYRDATGMGVVVGIDEVRALLETLQPPEAAETDAIDRAGTLRLLGQVGRPVFFPFAGLTARALPVEGGARFEIYDDFPATEYAQMALTSAAAGPSLELPITTAMAMPAASMTDALRDPVEHLDRELWRALGATLRMRRAVSGDDGSPAAHRNLAKLRRQLSSRQAEQKEVLSTIGYQSEAIAAGLASGIQKAAGGP